MGFHFDKSLIIGRNREMMGKTGHENITFMLPTSDIRIICRRTLHFNKWRRDDGENWT